MDLLVHIVDDDDLICSTLQRLCVKKGHRANVSCQGEEALRKIKDDPPDLILLDLSLPDINGLDLLKSIQAMNISTPIVMISGFGTVEIAVEALKLGARDFLAKPLDFTKVNTTIDNLLMQVRLEKEIHQIRSEQQNHFLCQHVIGQNPLIHKCYSLARSAATSDRLTVLITGESGTGKEFMAKYIHYNSPRHSRPLVTVNCSALPKDLVESELFGYEKGAFTGASSSGKLGRFELAHQGTLFLDEIGDLISQAQSKILRFLQEKEIQRVGSPYTKHLDVRIVAATNQNLEEFVKQGFFREDLYYRLNVMRIHLPPLRERREDILLFALHFINVFNQEFGKKILGLLPQGEKRLLGYHWPGNIRELRNVIERAVHLSQGPYLTEEHLLIEKTGSRAEPVSMSSEPHLPLREMEIRYVKRVLESLQGNKSQAAETLQISRARLRRILEGEEKALLPEATPETEGQKEP